MATAPPVGNSARDEAEADAQQIITITIDRDLVTAKGRPIPRSHEIGLANLPMRERLICRKATGFPIAAFWSEDRIDLDSLFVLWWMARRMNGEATLTFDQAAEQWPDDLDVEAELNVEVSGADDDGDEDSPEG